MARSEMSSGQAAHAALIEALRAGVFAPGDRLREEDVAQRLSLSRTPVREALRRMEAEGLVTHRPRLGAVVRQLTHAEVVELYEMRLVLERTAAEMAAKHGTAAEFDTLEALNGDIAAERSQPARAAAINQSFHRGLYHAARNRFLVQSAAALNNALILLGPTTFAEGPRVDEVVAEHAAIIAALRDGDQEAAGQAAAAHLQTSLRHRLRALGEAG
ncbi:GntR family transcriptional regulator [Pseudaestuariivita atlantica]|uniref:GntR family transcriptional regulator n=1 Tax=Pseudaestuariivita atlantica TaxID=1317121 RepID=A0A0L1JV55_9RHOB|nr:GntR family transcriptional regulator [Pseudaestuariivita atlantica]KNG95659.1 GntR family transcriptional regulator [Pseudaestuariivita atlantica]